MTEAEARLRTECLTERQADVVISTIKRFECWPADFRIQREPIDLPSGYVLVAVGERKGRPFVFGCSADGDVSS
jgi:hypothetical protein